MDTPTSPGDEDDDGPASPDAPQSPDQSPRLKYDEEPLVEIPIDPVTTSSESKPQPVMPPTQPAEPPRKREDPRRRDPRQRTKSPPRNIPAKINPYDPNIGVSTTSTPSTTSSGPPEVKTPAYMSNIVSSRPSLPSMWQPPSQPQQPPRFGQGPPPGPRHPLHPQQHPHQFQNRPPGNFLEQ